MVGIQVNWEDATNSVIRKDCLRERERGALPFKVGKFLWFIACSSAKSKGGK